MATELLQPGEQVKLFDNDAGTPPHQSAIYALPTTHMVAITWTTKFASAPSGVSVALQVSNDITGPWTALDTSTATTGETRTTNATGAAFVRAERTSQTGGGNITLTAVVAYQ